uniref:Evasin n=1 Tax=Amblyomma triste TaxID=251400 RepID=A0A023G2U9_AMBTT
MSSPTCLLYLLIVWAVSQVIVAATDRSSCKPREVQTEKGPIKAGCSAECQQGHNVRISHTEVECVSMTPGEYSRMGTAHHICRLGTCKGDTCEGGNLLIKCWKNCP